MTFFFQTQQETDDTRNTGVFVYAKVVTVKYTVFSKEYH